MKRLFPSQEREATAIIIEVRRLHNFTVRDAKDVDAWHKRVDDWLQMTGEETDSSQRWDNPVRVQCRKHLDRMLRGKD